MNERFIAQNLSGKARQRPVRTRDRLKPQEGKRTYKLFSDKPGFTTQAFREDHEVGARGKAREMMGPSMWLITDGLQHSVGITQDGHLFWIEGRAMHKPGPRKLAGYLESNKPRVDKFVVKPAPAPVAPVQMHEYKWERYLCTSLGLGAMVCLESFMLGDGTCQFRVVIYSASGTVSIEDGRPMAGVVMRVIRPNAGQSHFDLYMSLA